MPKTRYRVMRETLPERGALALNMMLMTATGQVSLDWADEADCARKVTAGGAAGPADGRALRQQPARATGKPSGYMSFRSRVWDEVDPARCGYFRRILRRLLLLPRLRGVGAGRAAALPAPRGEYLRPKLTFRQLLAEGFEGKPALTWPTGRTTSPRSSPRCGSRRCWRSAARTASSPGDDRRAARRCGAGCSTTPDPALEEAERSCPGSASTGAPGAPRRRARRRG